MAKRQASTNIIAGDLKGTKIYFKPNKALRPTESKTKETLFNWLLNDLDQKTCLDMFSGTGALGLEAISRGAKKVVFIERQKRLCQNLEEVLKKLKIEDPIIMVGRDCPRAEIWRMKIFPEYKGTRDTYEDDPSTNPGSFFKIAYKEKLFEECGGTILKHDNLEADDCIALTTRYIRKAYPNSNIYIIANDHDYLQLLYNENINVKVYFKGYKTDLYATNLDLLVTAFNSTSLRIFCAKDSSVRVTFHFTALSLNLCLDISNNPKLLILPI